MPDVDMRIEGVDAIIKKMREVNGGIRLEAGRSALGSAARVISKAAKENVMRSDDPETGRRIANNITQRFRARYYKRTGDLMVSVGVATPKGRIPKGNPDEGSKGPTPHWHLIELGTENSKEQPFLRTAAIQNGNRAIQVFGSRLIAGIDKLVKS